MVLFINSILLLNNLNEVVVIAYGARSCGHVFSSNLEKTKNDKHQVSPSSRILKQLEEVLSKEVVLPGAAERDSFKEYSLLSGALSMSLCCILLIRKVKAKVLGL